MGEMMYTSSLGRMNSTARAAAVPGGTTPSVVVYDGPHRLLSTSTSPFNPFDCGSVAVAPQPALPRLVEPCVLPGVTPQPVLLTIF
jgi:hypothetical protein